MVVQNFRYRIYPSKKQEQRLERAFSDACNLYNKLLEAKIKEYKKDGKNLSQFDLNKITKEFDSQYLYSQVKQNLSKRISDAFSHFFRRIKEKKGKAGFPRFKKEHRYRSITYPQTNGFKFISDKKIYVGKIGNIEIILHRVLKGKMKTLTIKKSADKWYAIFSCENVPIEKIIPENQNIGIDVGLESFAVLSDGMKIENPRYLKNSEKKLKFLQRKLSRKKKGSVNRKRARFEVARLHERIFNQRQDFLHKVSLHLVKEYNIISVENLNIANMQRNHNLAKSINDASWGTLMGMLCYKVSRTDGRIIEVSARNTSRTCSNCGNIQEIGLDERLFACKKCGFQIHRDLNSAININRAGLVQINACGDTASTPRENLGASSIVEAGNYRGENAQP